MARPFEELKHINDSKELWKIAVRIHHKWTVVSKNKEHFEMILCDKEIWFMLSWILGYFGFMVYEHDVFKPYTIFGRKHSVLEPFSNLDVIFNVEFLLAFDSVLMVNSTYTISNFQVSLNDMLFKPTEHKFLLTFTGGTSVTDINKHDIPPKPLNFTPFAEILTGKWKKDVLIDVIGMVSEIGYTQIQAGNKKQQINLVLKDLCNNILNCTLWEGYAMQFHEFQKQRKDLSSPTVIVLQFAKVKEEGLLSFLFLDRHV
ncbi:uncharacterized protein LOC131659576 [Vicia villosa]|uniref:uncharacterized protein LOC131659576 n=1 Tax=Vicia villosa TaxID=3911 RepID=UPI00273B4318|nr:uncharacterized protein LOC131659576 [Vicia villosa]